MKSSTTYTSLLAAVGLLFGVSTQPALGLVTVNVQPGSQVAFVGSNVGFTAQVSATAGEIITGYTWLTSPNGLNPFTTVPGATTATCTLVNVQTNDTGYYFARVTYNSGTTIGLTTVSSAVILTVADQARITAQPQGGLIRTAGTSASFSVSAMGFPLPGYQWRLNGMSLSDSDRISGVNTPNLTLGALVTADTGNYDVVVTNAYSAVTSQVATLSVYLPAGISVPPQNTAVIVGSNAVLSVIASGSEPLSYQWQKGGMSLVDGGRISGATSNVLTIAATTTNDAGDYTVCVTNPVSASTCAVATLTVLVPVNITSATNASGKQGVAFSFTVKATGTPPIIFGASGLPAGLSFDPITGIIAGTPIVSGAFPVTIGASNVCSSVTQVLTLTIASSVPVITSATTATGTENLSGFSYNIRASNSPTLYGASGLPLGLTVNTNTGAITGTPLFGGTFNALVWAINAWGAGSTNLTLNIAYTTIGGLAIADVTHVWSKPYLLDFSFALRDGPDPSTNSPVVVPPSKIQVTCMEDGVPIITNESPIILESAVKKQLRSCFVLDYTYSMLAVPGAIDAMQSAAKLLINEEPANALFGIYEFHADYVNPQLVTTNPAAKSAFLSDKPTLSTIIDGIQTNYVQGNYAGTRCWDAMYAALKLYGATNNDEQRYLIAMTDGNDSSSLLNTNANPVSNIVALAQSAQVKIFCVAFGSDVNTNSLQQLTSQTGGHYYLAATTDDLAIEFQKIVKDVSGQYLLRWATLKRGAKVFQPSFQVTYGGFTDTFNTNLIYQTNEVYSTNITVDPSQTPPVTNIDITTNLVVTNIVSLPYNPPDWSNDVRVGFLRLAPDANVGPQTTRLRADYVPRFIREMRLNYRPNYPCTSSLQSNGTNDILYGWSMTETADTNGLRTLTIMSPDTNNLLTSIEYAAFGDLVSFNFTYPESLTATQAFSLFSMDNTIYTNMLPSGQSFVLSNATSFVTSYPPPPPHGTPIPWLIYYGYKTNFADAELIATNGLPVWQDYVAGLNPTNVNSQFTVSMPLTPGQPPQIIFSTVATRTYRVETATSLDTWAVLLDSIPGTGGNILFIDNRVLTSVNPVFYRVAVY
jgi:hypothetical protein